MRLPWRREPDAQPEVTVTRTTGLVDRGDVRHRCYPPPLDLHGAADVAGNYRVFGWLNWAVIGLGARWVCPDCERLHQLQESHRDGALTYAEWASTEAID
jgi:hypothetical protein